MLVLTSLSLILLSVPIINCRVALDCGVPPSIEGGTSTYSKTLQGYYATYQCEPGYNMDASSNYESKCMETGVWSKPPRCHKIRCDRWLPEVNNSVRVVQGFYYKDVISFRCYPGYTLEGNANTTCGMDGYWTPPPTCAKVICGDAPTVENAGISALGDLMFASTVHYECFSGYQFQGVPYVTCLSTGDWTKAPNCTNSS